MIKCLPLLPKSKSADVHLVIETLIRTYNYKHQMSQHEVIILALRERERESIVKKVNSTFIEFDHSLVHMDLKVYMSYENVLVCVNKYIIQIQLHVLIMCFLIMHAVYMYMYNVIDKAYIYRRGGIHHNCEINLLYYIAMVSQ